MPRYMFSTDRFVKAKVRPYSGAIKKAFLPFSDLRIIMIRNSVLKSAAQENAIGSSLTNTREGHADTADRGL